MSETICLIPARNNSTRFKNKNIQSFKNGTLITNTIDQALDSEIFNRIVLTSNDLNILNDVENYCKLIETHLRDDKEDQLLPVIRNTINDLKLNRNDIIGLLLVTCPLRSVDDIKNAFDIYLKNDNQCVMSVCINENPIQLSWTKISKNHEFLNPVMPYEYYKSTRKQDHQETYHYNDAIIFDSVENFLNIKRRTLFGHNPIPYIMPLNRSIAIDYEFQWRVANCLAKESEI